MENHVTGVWPDYELAQPNCCGHEAFALFCRQTASGIHVFLRPDAHANKVTLAAFETAAL